MQKTCHGCDHFDGRGLILPTGDVNQERIVELGDCLFDPKPVRKHYQSRCHFWTPADRVAPPRPNVTPTDLHWLCPQCGRIEQTPEHQRHSHPLAPEGTRGGEPYTLLCEDCGTQMEPRPAPEAA